MISNLYTISESTDAFLKWKCPFEFVFFGSKVNHERSAVFDTSQNTCEKNGVQYFYFKYSYANFPKCLTCMYVKVSGRIKCRSYVSKTTCPCLKQLKCLKRILVFKNNCMPRDRSKGKNNYMPSDRSKGNHDDKKMIFTTRLYLRLTSHYMITCPYTRLPFWRNIFEQLNSW